MTQDEFRNIAWHVHIQWLASQDLLVWWMDAIIDDEHRYTRIDPSFTIETHAYNFIQYIPCCPSWSREGETKMDVIRNRWVPIGRKLSKQAREYELK